MSLSSRLRAMLRPPFRSTDPAEAVELLNGGALMLDVREHWEWDTGHAPQARHVPLAQLLGAVGQMPRDRTIIAVCRSGMRSARAARLLAGEGYDVINLAGGMEAWRRAGLPVVGRRRAGRR